MPVPLSISPSYYSLSTNCTEVHIRHPQSNHRACPPVNYPHFLLTLNQYIHKSNPFRVSCCRVLIVSYSLHYPASPSIHPCLPFFPCSSLLTLFSQFCGYPHTGIDGQIPPMSNVGLSDRHRLSHSQNNVPLGPSIIALGSGLGLAPGSGLAPGPLSVPGLGLSQGLSRYRLFDPLLGLDVTYTSCWQHREDVKGKPGLIADTCYAQSNAQPNAQSNAQSNLRTPQLNRINTSQSNLHTPQSNIHTSASNHLIFPVSYGAIPRLMITFLQTYSNDTGCVEIYYFPLVPPFRANTTSDDSSGHHNVGFGPSLRSGPGASLRPVPIASPVSGAGSPGPGASLGPGTAITNESQLTSLPWQRLAYIDPKLTSRDQYDQVSLTWTHVYVPHNNEKTNTLTNSTAATPIKLYGEFVSAIAMRPHSSYLLMVGYLPLHLITILFSSYPVTSHRIFSNKLILSYHDNNLY